MSREISLVVFTHNSQERLDFDKSFLEIFAQKIAIDDRSEDETKKRLQELGFEVFDLSFEGDFAKRHNQAMDKCRYGWVFFLDDDEKPDKELVEAIRRVCLSPDVGGYMVHRKDVVLGRVIKHGEQGRMQLLRLVNRGSGRWVRAVHEYFETKKRTKRLAGVLVHDQGFGVERFVSKAEFYGRIDAGEMTLKGRKFGWIEMGKPFAKFVKNYIIHLGFLDGYRGLFLAYLMSLQSLIVRIYHWELSRES